MIGPNLAQRNFIWQYVGYTPSAEQLRAHLADSRIRLVAGGERAGKSLSGAMELLCHVIGRPGLFWVVAPDYEQARPEFNYILGALQKIGAVQTVNNPRIGACRIETKFGGTIVTKTAADATKLAGVAPDGVLLVEAAQTDWHVWLKLRGRVAEKRGWLWASGTFEAGSQWYVDLWTRWQAANPEGGESFSIPTWSNLAVFPGGREDPEIVALAATLPPDLFQERYGAVPCKPAGLVFKEFAFEEHVREVNWRMEIKTPGIASGQSGNGVTAGQHWPVEIAIDPGYAGAYAVLAITWLDDFVLVFDEVYEAGMVAEDVIAQCKKRWWWKKVKGGVIDIAGLQHPGDRSQVEIWRNAAGLRLRVNRVGVVEGILRLRTFLKNPATGQTRIYFNPRCKGLLTEFGKYRYPKDTEHRPVKEEPIDRDNHAVKALAYWLYDRYGPVLRPKRRPQPGVNPFDFTHDETGRSITLLPGHKGGVRFGPKAQRAITTPAFSFEVHHE